MEQIGAVVDKSNTLRFKRLKEAVELRIVAIEGAKQMDILLEEDALNIQLIQELWQQRDKLNRRRERRPLDLGIYKGALTQQQLPSTIDQEMDKMLS